jgi:methylaspartate mutase sigma subunit
MSQAEPPALSRPALARRPAGPGVRTVVVSSLVSDAHTWNLVFLQLLLEESGLAVVNLGPCVPPELLVATCRDLRPLLVVLSSVNGHGYQDGLRAIRALRTEPELADTPVVIGGKLGVSADGRTEHAEHLLAVGYDGVYDDAQPADGFRELVRSLAVAGP